LRRLMLSTIPVKVALAKLLDSFWEWPPTPPEVPSGQFFPFGPRVNPPVFQCPLQRRLPCPGTVRDLSHPEGYFYDGPCPASQTTTISPSSIWASFGSLLSLTPYAPNGYMCSEEPDLGVRFDLFLNVSTWAALIQASSMVSPP